MRKVSRVLQELRVIKVTRVTPEQQVLMEPKVLQV